MLMRKKIFIAAIFSILAFTFAAPAAAAAAKAKGGNEYERIVKHLKTKYRAKKVSIPFLWLARAAVRVVRPAGVKSFNITLFENLQFSRDTLDVEMQAAMRNSFSADWSPIFHVRSRQGEQVYMYMREDGKDVRLALVTIDRNQAAVVRARFSPEKLAEFVNNPKIFGISLSDNNRRANPKDEDPKPKEETLPEGKKEESLPKLL
jgi:hypothetical protein